jgi:ABC-type transporter Mla subunit MlaD
MLGRSIYVRVGLFIIGGIAALVGLVWFLGGTQVVHGVVIESYFRESVQGLEVGAPIKYRGVTVGRVTELGLVSAEYGTGNPAQFDRQTYRLVFVRYIVDRARIGNVPETAQAVALGLRARLASQGITGLTYIELDFVDPKLYPEQAVPWQPKADYIPSMPSTLSQVQDAAQQVLAKLNKVDVEALTTSIANLVTDLRTEMATGDVHVALVQARDLLHTLNDAVTQSDLPGLAADLRSTSGAARQTLAGGETQRLIANAAIAAERLGTAATKLPALIAMLQATAQRANNGTADVEQAIAPILRDMQVTVQNLRELTDALRRSPAQVLLSQPPPRSTEPAR